MNNINLYNYHLNVKEAVKQYNNFWGIEILFGTKPLVY
jgi:hypothetical protein